MDDNSIAEVKACMTQLSSADLDLLLQYMRKHTAEWDQAKPCEESKKLLRTALSAKERKKYFIMGIVLTMIFNIIGIVMFYFLAQNTVLIDVPEIAKSVN